jgi:lipid-binding SYLF domain-containing protein
MAGEGRSGTASGMYSYSRSQGLFAGISLEGTALNTRDHFNEAYYGRPVEARDILEGKVPPPRRGLAGCSPDCRNIERQRSSARRQTGGARNLRTSMARVTTRKTSLRLAARLHAV